MTPYSPTTITGLSRAVGYIHHRTATVTRNAARRAAKASRHAARQHQKRIATRQLSELS